MNHRALQPSGEDGGSVFQGEQDIRRRLMKMRRSCHIVGGCLVIAMMASACGSDDDDDSVGPSGGTSGGTGASSGSGGSGGIAGSQPEGSGGASSGGTAGSETGGTAGTGGTSGEQSGGSSGTPSGGSSGTPTGGSGGQQTGGSSGTPSGGTAGQGGTGGVAGGTGGAMGGTAGQGGTGGAGGGGAGVLDPPSPGIACGDATCDEGSEMCCADESSRSCTTSGCSGNVIRLDCDDSADCPGEGCCFSNIFSSVRIATFCTSDCASIGYTQVCKEPGDCDNGEVCHAFSCGGFDTGSVTLGLCAATAPGACE
jgi:hypothetical protein